MTAIVNHLTSYVDISTAANIMVYLATWRVCQYVFYITIMQTPTILTRKCKHNIIHTANNQKFVCNHSNG